MTKRAELHTHTDYSNIRLIDSINKTTTLIDRAFELGLSGVAITDHDCISSHLKAELYYNKTFSEEQKKNFKLILGNEIYLTRSDLNAANHQKGEKFFHFILLALDDIGHKQLRRISSRAWKRSYYKNLIRTPTYAEDLIDIIQPNQGHIVCTTACLGGYCGYNFLNRNYSKIDNHLSVLKDIFGENNMFIELQPSLQKEQIDYNNHMVENYWGKYNFTCATDAHYLSKEEKEYHKYFLQSKEAERELGAFYDTTYLMDDMELSEFFSSGGLSEDIIKTMINNTISICDRVKTYTLKKEQDIPKIKYNMPEIDNFWFDIIKKYPNETKFLQKVIDKKAKADYYLLELIKKGWHNLLDFNTLIKKEKEYVIELDYELEQLYEISNKLKKELSDYFITMSFFIDIIWSEGDSLVGTGRGSAGSSLINYLIRIIQVNPLEQPMELPFWRFIHKDRPELPDIDIDAESNKKTKIFNKIQEYMISIGGELINVCTFGTEGTKSAIKTSCRGLNIDQDIANYLNNMVPNIRGKDLTIDQCYYGDADNQPIKSFKTELDKYPVLFKLAKRIEGLITRVGVHSGGIVALNSKIYETNSLLKTSQGALVTAFNLDDTEMMGGLKYDFLTIKALDKIRTTLNLLLEDDIIEWQGSLRKTYDKYLLPKVLEVKDPKMWEMLHNGEVPSCFQFDTMVGTQAVKMIKPGTLLELGSSNNIMRLSAKEKEQPLNTYARYKNDLQLWYDEMNLYMLSKDEIAILERHLLPLYGVADSQESAMKLVMDKNISNFTLAEANGLRKAIAKKKEDVLEKTKLLFYKKGKEANTSKELLDYVWNIQISRQIGYSFSVIHTIAYSYIAIQEMNLCYRYPSIYWKTACLSDDASANNDEDYFNLVERGIIDLSTEKDSKKSTKIDYGRIAGAIGKMKDQVKIELPDINIARMGFTPNTKDNSVVFGMKAISSIGDDVINEIIIDRPYKNMEDFLHKHRKVEGIRVLLSKNKIINLIKAGCFDKLENKNRKDILFTYIQSITDQKKKLNLMNFQMLINFKMTPKELDFTVRVYNFTKHIRKSKYKGQYILDEDAYEFYNKYYNINNITEMRIEDEIRKIISIATWDSIYQKEMDKARAWIKSNHDDLLEELNKKLLQIEIEKYAKGNILDWELDSINFFHSGHPLDGVEPPTEITKIQDLIENDFDGSFLIKGKIIPKHKLKTIMGTVIAKDKQAGLVTVATLDGVIAVKFFKQLYSFFDREIVKYNEETDEKITQEDSFFEKGTHLLITGIKVGENFMPKVYKNTGFEPILKIVLDENKNIKYLLRKS